MKKLYQTKIIKKKIIFDGYPRNLSQAENLNKLLIKHDQKIDIVIRLKVSLDIIKKRITGRVICSKCGKTYNKFFNPPTKDESCCKKEFLQTRDDDNVDVAIKRFKTYEESTEPVLQYYKKMNLAKDVNGEADIESIYRRINDYLTLIEG